MAAYPPMARILNDAIQDHAGGRWVATGGGGYQPTTVVPKVWTIHFAEMVGRPDAIPSGWLDDVAPEEVSRPNRSEIEGSVKTVLDSCVPRLEALASV
jgi:acetoin utilization deacetylase AcuC-like enzyme